MLWVLLLPDPGTELNLFQKGVIVLIVSISLIWLFAILLDKLKPIWLQSIAPMLLFIEIFLIVYFYSGGDFDNLAFVFANEKVMDGQWGMLFQGLKMTIILALFSIVFSTLGGLLLAILRAMNNKIISAIIIAYLTFFRVMPLLVILMFIYFGLPSLNIYLDAFVSAVLTLSMAGAAFISEVFRAGIESIHHTQIEASRALGLNFWQSMRLVVLPQAIKIVVPSVVNQWVGTLKDTSITALVSLTELLKASKIISTWKANPTPLIAAALIYLVLLIPLTLLVSYLEKRSKSRGKDKGPITLPNPEAA